jgi:hypothetical protein
VDTVNPYESPKFPFEIVPSSGPRVVGFGLIAGVGMAIGGISFLLAMALIPASVPSLSEHDLRLANHLGFIYPPLVGLWAGWVRRSVPWAVFGVISGLLIGGLYYVLCGYDFLAVMVAFPCLLGGCGSVLLGTKHDSWIAGIPQRFLKGLVAGFVLGLVYAVLLNVIGMFLLSRFPPSVADYSFMMWRAGTIAMVAASGLYFLLFHWSAGLHPVLGKDNGSSAEPEAGNLA